MKRMYSAEAILVPATTGIFATEVLRRKSPAPRWFIGHKLTGRVGTSSQPV
jgi:hypothetical protein